MLADTSPAVLGVLMLHSDLLLMLGKVTGCQAATICQLCTASKVSLMHCSPEHPDEHPRAAMHLAAPYPIPLLNRCVACCHPGQRLCTGTFTTLCSKPALILHQQWAAATIASIATATLHQTLTLPAPLGDAAMKCKHAST